MGSANNQKTIHSNASSVTKRSLEGGINQCKTLEIKKQQPVLYTKTPREISVCHT